MIIGIFKGAIAIKIKQYTEINQAFGPRIAEKLLVSIAQQLKSVIRDQGIIGQLENNQFHFID